MAVRQSVRDKAAEIRALGAAMDPAEHANFDQASSEWRDAYSVLGIDLAALTPDEAAMAFSTLQIALFLLVDTAGDLESFGSTLIAGAVALANVLL